MPSNLNLRVNEMKTESRAAAAASKEEVTASELSLLDKIIVEGNMISEPSQSPYARKLIGQLASQILDEGMRTAPDKGVMTLINERIAEIDQLLTDQLNVILHAPQFQALEASWTGLRDMVMGTETGVGLKLRLLNVSKKDLLKDLESAVDHDTSALFKKIYEEEYGTFGGYPYSLLVGDYQFGRSPQDVALLERISRVAAAAHAPFVSAASPALFDFKSFVELGVPRDLSKIFESAELTGWRSFRESEDARYAALVLPSYAARLPYGAKTSPVESFNFEEDVDGSDHSKYLWANAAYQLALRVTAAHAQFGWTTAIRGVEGGGKIDGLVAHTYKTDEGDIALKSPTEVTITDRREKELNDLGFIAMVNAKGTNTAAFFGGQTLQKPKVYDKDAANASAALSARLPYVLAASRFAHYLKVIARDKVGSFQTQNELQRHLNNWISNYVLLSPEAPQEAKARLPLSAGRVDVSEVPGRPGSYRAVAFLKPHFQLEDLSASIRLVADLPQSAA